VSPALNAAASPNVQARRFQQSGAMAKTISAILAETLEVGFAPQWRKLKTHSTKTGTVISANLAETEDRRTSTGSLGHIG